MDILKILKQQKSILVQFRAYKGPIPAYKGLLRISSAKYKDLKRLW